jgi:hypothetical protein
MAGELHEEFRTEDPKRIANCEPRFLLRARALHTFLDEREENCNNFYQNI